VTRSGNRGDGLEARVLNYTIPGEAPGKPRMSQRDKWKKRDCVVAYFGWCDLARKHCPDLPTAVSVDAYSIIAYYRPPASWSVAKQTAAIGTVKRTKPDGDNVLKAVCDALWKDDHALGDIAGVYRRYDWQPRLCLTLAAQVPPGITQTKELPHDHSR
jgi:hypothetical protein